MDRIESGHLVTSPVEETAAHRKAITNRPLFLSAIATRAPAARPAPRKADATQTRIIPDVTGAIPGRRGQAGLGAMRPASGLMCGPGIWRRAPDKERASKIVLARTCHGMVRRILGTISSGDRRLASDEIHSSTASAVSGSCSMEL